MVSGIQNVGFNGINTATSAQPYIAAPYQYAAQCPAADTVQISGKVKKSGAKKAIFAAIGTTLVAAAALYAGVKTGKLTKVNNATKFTEKLQNLAYNGGSYVCKGVDAAKNSKVGQTVVDYGTKAINWIKGIFTKKF